MVENIYDLHKDHYDGELYAANSNESFRSGPPLDLLLPFSTSCPPKRRTSSTTDPAKLDIVARALMARTSHVATQSDDRDEAFFVADLGEVYRQYMRWRRNLPRVEPFYAVKCNPDPRVLNLLAKLGTGFDCASKAEIQQVMDLGVSTDKIVYANPCKGINHLRYASDRGVRLITFDNADELVKCKKHFPNAHFLLRILTDDVKSLCRLGLKYGAPLHVTYNLLRLARELGLKIVGVSFHVGSGNDNDPAVFVDSCERARKIFQEAKQLGFGDLEILDIGGGFGHENFENIAASLRPTIDELFAPHVRVIAEPGRYFVASAYTLAVNVIARRLGSDDFPQETGFEDVEKSVMYYVNDGVYGSFNCILFDHQQPMPRILKRGSDFHYNSSMKKISEISTASRALADDNGMINCSIWGPTCDSLDCISREIRFPCVLDVGDWLYFEDMGAYTLCASTEFNGFSRSKILHVCSEPKAFDLCRKGEFQL